MEMAVLEARESILTANRQAMGSGTLERSTAERLAFDWKTAAEVQERSTRPSDEQLRAMGVKVRRGAQG